MDEGAGSPAYGVGAYTPARRGGHSARPASGVRRPASGEQGSATRPLGHSATRRTRLGSDRSHSASWPSGLHSLRMTAYSRGMSTPAPAPTPAPTPADDRPTEVLPAAAPVPVPVPVRRSILRPARPGPQEEGAPFADWRGQAQTEELAAVPAPSRRNRPARRSACRHSAARRHLRAALIGTLLAIVAISSLSAYAAAGITDARSTALCQAHLTCR